MTRTRDKLRSLFLTLLLVVSAMGTTVAFSGAAAAATNTSISLSDDSNGATGVTYTLEGDVDSSGSLEDVNVDLGSGADVSSVGSGDVTVEVNGGSQSIGSVSASGETVDVTLSSSTTVSNGDTLTVEIQDVTNDQSGSHSASVDFLDTSDNSIDSFSETYSISGSSSRERIGEADVTWTSSGGPYWQGQKLFLKNADDPNTEYNIREADGDNIETFVSDLTLDENGEAVVDTGDVGGGQSLEGEYVVTKNGNAVEFDGNGEAIDTNADVSDASIEVTEQSFSAAFEEENVRSNLAEIEFSSNRGRYDLVVASNSLDAGELEGIFTNFTIVDNPDDDDDDEITIRVDQTTDVRDLDFSNVDSDEYTFEFQVNDTTASDDATVNIEQAEDAEAAFLGDGVYETAQGGIVEIPIELENTDTAKINLGYDGQVYNETVEVEDDDDDDRVTLRVNTYLAGRQSLAEGDPTDLDDGDGSKDDIAVAYSLADDDDDILSVSRLGDGIGSPPLAPTLYDVNISAGDRELDVGAMSIQEAGEENLRSWTAPAQTFNDIDDKEEFFEARDEDELLTRDDTIANGDTLIYQIESSSLVGALEAETDDNDYADGLATLLDDNDDVVEAESFIFNIEQERAVANREPKRLDFEDTDNSGGLTVISDNGNGSVYVLFDTDQMNMDRGDSDNDLGIGTDDYETNYTIGPNSGIPDEDDRITVTDQFETVERTLDFDTGSDDLVQVRAEPDQLVSGETSVAAGTTLRLRLRGTQDQRPFLKTPEVTVSEGGNFSTLVDFSDQPGNTSFEAEASRFEGTTPGIILPPRSASVAFVDQSTFGTQVTVDEVNTSDGGFVAIHRNSPTGDVVGSSDLLDNGTVRDVEIEINADLVSGETLYAVPHFDDNEDAAFSEGIDPAYEQDGSAVSASADITIRTPTPTTTERPTTTEPPTTTTTTTPPITLNTTTAPENETTTTTTGPGLTVGIALLALLAAALLAARRFE